LSRGVGEEHSLAALDDLFKAAVDPAETAARVIEPVQDEGPDVAWLWDNSRAWRGHGFALFAFLRSTR